MNRFAHWFRSWEFALAMVLVVELIVLGIINPAFLNIENLLFSTSDFVHIIIAAVGLTLIIMTGGMDISGVSVMGLASIVAGLSYVAGAPIELAVVFALLVGFGAGAFNGTVVANTDVNPLVITLAMMFLYAGIATGLPTLLDMMGFASMGPGGFEAYQYEGISGLPKHFTWLGTGGIGWIPNPLIIAVIIGGVASWLMLGTRFGRYLKLIGVSADVARFTGVPVKRTLITVYAINGLTAAIAGLVLTAYFTSARSDLGADAPVEHHHGRGSRRLVHLWRPGLCPWHLPGRPGARLSPPGASGPRHHLGRCSGHRRLRAHRHGRPQDRHVRSQHQTCQPGGLCGRAAGCQRKRRMTQRHPNHIRGRQTARNNQTPQ